MLRVTVFSEILSSEYVEFVSDENFNGDKSFGDCYCVILTLSCFEFRQVGLREKSMIQAILSLGARLLMIASCSLTDRGAKRCRDICLTTAWFRGENRMTGMFVGVNDRMA